MISIDVLPSNWRDFISLDHRRVALGIDPATTTRQKSNPTAIALLQQVGLMVYVRLLVRFKTSDDRVTTAIAREIATTLPHGLKLRRLCILATNERFYAAALKRHLAGIVPVEMLIESEATQYLGQKMLFKAYLGNLLCNQIEDGYLALPDEPWVKSDIRQVVRDKGTFTAEVDEDGSHADGFSAITAALHGLAGPGGPAIAAAIDITGEARPNPGWKNPFYHIHQPGGRVKTHA
jgi:hypothetical protein